MSTYSQPVNTISYSQHSIPQNQRYKPKYLNEDDDDKLNSTMDYQSNKLPLNLFHSAAQYNKMLITYGKNRKQNSAPITDGIISSLQYVNDHIFEKKLQERTKAIQSIHQSIKPAKKSIQNCVCCCCHDFCRQCAGKGVKKCNKLSNSEVKNIREVIDNDIKFSRKSRKSSVNQSIKSKKSNHNKNFAQGRKAHSSIDTRSINKRGGNEESLLNSKKSRDVDISHLVIKSLIQFTQKKKAESLLAKSKQDAQKVRHQYIQLLNQKIRSSNLSASRSSRSKSRIKKQSLAKHDLATKYWEQIKDDVLNSLKNDNYSGPLKQQLANYKFQVYDHKEVADRKPKLSKQKMELLRVKHGQEAKKEIDQLIKIKKQKAQQLKKKLRSLQIQRIAKIRQAPQTRFNPSQEMINGAFQNLNKPQQNQEYQQRSRDNKINHNRSKSKGIDVTLKCQKNKQTIESSRDKIGVNKIFKNEGIVNRNNKKR